ncbi:FadR/GntR family transcriptional regulator [Brachybacterium aquaticum]|uniref:GntR family transcriptional repressor for pyruvate dehydrogenase complex n=1 Tax=Brachybacterium aquaticum TaxID=1432564 RepID=A0A841AAA9_9MICO|nr:FCD domain-containing protein [Brachybacterium aquaticum]MBB5830883.1 GntR family transcriptional repressor for pyruvate dehydrogenase complex [Brachybacterium aquaticum]
MPSDPVPSGAGRGPSADGPAPAGAVPTGAAPGLGDTAWRYLTAPTAADSSALSRDTLVGQARQAVLDLIDADGLEAGDALPSVGALSERFGCSKAVVREALSALGALGIIEIANGRAARVRPPDTALVRFYLSRALRGAPGEGFSTLMDLRSPLEVRAAALAATRLGRGGAPSADGAGTDGGSDGLGPADAVVPADGIEAERAELTALLARMGEALGDSEEYPRLDLQLHATIARLSASPALQGVLDAVSVPLFRAMRELRVTREARGLVGVEHTEHTRIVEAILAGDAEAAAAAMAEHMAAVEAFDDVGTTNRSGTTDRTSTTDPAVASPDLS